VFRPTGRWGLREKKTAVQGKVKKISASATFPFGAILARVQFRFLEHVRRTEAE